MDLEVDFKTKVSALGPRAREWFACAMVSMVLADGSIDRGEMNFMLKMIQLVRDPLMAARLKKFIQHKVSPPLGMPVGIGRKEGMSMIIDLIRVAVVDQDFDKSEKELIFKIGNSLGFREDEIDKLVLYGFELMATSAEGVLASP